MRPVSAWREFGWGAPAGATPAVRLGGAPLVRATGQGAARAAGARLQIVVTPGSGEGRALSTAGNVQRALSAAGYSADVQTFNDLDHLVRWSRICDASFSHLLCVGGDSTQSAAALAALRLAVPLVPVPTGFGNMFARAFGHRARPEAVLRVIEQGEVGAIDVGRAGDELFLSHRSYGPLQEVEALVENGRDRLRPRLLRNLAYYLTAGRYLAQATLPSICVEVDGIVLSNDAVIVTVANVETYRGFLSLTPAAVPTDGFFDVFVMPRASKAQLWMKLVKLWLRSEGCWDGIVLRRGRRVRITINGAPLEETRILPAALHVLVPPGSLERLAARKEARHVSRRRRSPPSPVRSTGRAVRPSVRQPVARAHRRQHNQANPEPDNLPAPAHEAEAESRARPKSQRGEGTGVRSF
jgi:diacylglycerol kinase (ATP)